MLASPDLPGLSLSLGYNGSVVAIAPAEKRKSICAFGKNIVVVPATHDRSGTAFCVTAALDALSVEFQVPATPPYASLASMQCTALQGPAPLPPFIKVVARVGRAARPGQPAVYDGGRAECDLNPGFAYAFAVEKLGTAGLVSTAKQSATRTLTIPWSLLHLNGRSSDLMIRINELEFVVPLHIAQRGASVTTDYAPFIRLATPGPAGAPMRSHDIELNFAYNWDRDNMFAASFAQNQANVAVQRALSNALSLAPVSLPAPNMRMSIGQDLQTQSQSLFAFQQPSNYLEDQSLKPLVDALPFSVTKLSSLASGYAYGYTSETLAAAAFYGLQGPRAYSGGATATFILTTPAPSPEPAPRPTPVKTGNMQYEPLRPPAPPAPFFESGTASTPPFQLSVLNGFSGSKGTRDVMDALAFEAHVYQNQVRQEGTPNSQRASYAAQTVNLFGRLEHDFRIPAVAAPASISQFIGESATFTSGTFDSSHGEPSEHYFQLRETVGAQVNDRNFAPSIGTGTFLSSLSGPVAHVTAAWAAGKNARYYALDLLGFRLTNVNGDSAAQEGWQVSIPVAGPGWLLSGGSETQTVSDRIAAIEQGLTSGYVQAVSQVAHPQTRPQRLANVSLLSPWFPNGKTWQFQLAAGYNTGTVTACAATGSRASSLQCFTAMDNRTVGGLFLKNGTLALGVTDTSVASGSVSAGDAARNLGTSGGLPGSLTAYINFTGCPQIAAAYTNAAFPSGVPFPQQGFTLSSQLDYPLAVGQEQLDFVLGYFNEHSTGSAALDESGFSAILRLGTTFRKTSTVCSK